MTDSRTPQANDNAQEPELDPEIAALLDFEPVPRRFKKADGWTAPLQREFIAELARHGSPTRACEAVGKVRSGVDKLYKSPKAEGFRAAWDKAIELAERRRAAELRAEHSAVAGLRPPFVDHRRKAAPDPGLVLVWLGGHIVGRKEATTSLFNEDASGLLILKAVLGSVSVLTGLVTFFRAVGVLLTLPS